MDGNGDGEVELPQRSRSNRRREDTRRKLMKSAYELIAARGLDGLIIQDITQAADVGYGSFYNHFASKDAIVDAVIDAARIHSGETCERLTKENMGTLECLTSKLRTRLTQAKIDKTWGHFVVRTVLTGDTRFGIGIAEDLFDLIEAGLNEGVFRHTDSDLVKDCIAGLLLVGIIKLISGETPAGYEDRIVSCALWNLGVAEDKLARVLHTQRPVSDIPRFLDLPASGR